MLKKVFKFLFSLVVLVLFIVFMNVILFNTILNNTLLNVNYYQETIYETEFTSEARLLTIDYFANEIANDYQGELDQEIVFEIVNEALLNTFENRWFQSTMRLFALEMVEYAKANKTGFYTFVQIDSEKIEYRRQIARSINNYLDNLTQEELIAFTNEIEEASNLPSKIELNEIINTYMPQSGVEALDMLALYRNVLVLGFYVIFAGFIFLFYIIGGGIFLFRWLGIGIIMGAFSFATLIYQFLNNLILEQLSVLGFPRDVIIDVIDLMIKHSIKLWGGALFTGIVIFIISILMKRRSKKNKITKKEVTKDNKPTNEKKSSDMVEEKTEKEPEILGDLEDDLEDDLEKETASVANDFDPLAEKPPQEKEANKADSLSKEPTNEKISAEEFYKKVESISEDEK